MPTLFVAEAVPTGFAVFDPRPSRRLFDAARRLDLRRDNVFIERSGVFEPVDRLFDEGEAEFPLRAVVYGNDGPIKDLGGTRLLREIGLRLLRAGHIPLLLHYPSENSASKPKRPREAVADVISRLMRFSQVFEVPVAQATVLGAYGRSVPQDAYTVQELRDLGDDEGQDRLALARDGFRSSPQDLQPDIAARRMAADLSAFADQMARQGPPFGAHSRVVVLADELSSWGDGATGVLELADREGFGLRGVLIATGSYGQESPLKGFRDAHTHEELSGYVFPDLAELTPGEARLGYQWVLLNPWKRDQPTYARARQADPQALADSFSVFGTKPAIVGKPQFYEFAEIMSVNWLLMRNDDELAFNATYPDVAR
jgi:hypothetical protein